MCSLKPLVLAVSLTLASTAALAQSSDPASTPGSAVAAVGQAPGGDTREGLQAELKQATEQILADKRALSQARKGTDKAAVQEAQTKVRQDAKRVSDINRRLRILKVKQRAAKSAKGDARPAKGDARPAKGDARPAKSKSIE